MEGFCKRKTLAGISSFRIIRSMQMAWDFANRTAATGYPVDVFAVAALTTDILPVFRFLADYVFTLYIILFYTFPFIFHRYFEMSSVYESRDLRARCYRTNRVYPHVNFPKYKNPYPSLSLRTGWEERLLRFFSLPLYPTRHVYNW